MNQILVLRGWYVVKLTKSNQSHQNIDILAIFRLYFQLGLRAAEAAHRI